MQFRAPRLTSVLSGLVLLAIVGFLAQGFLHRSEYAAEPGAANDPPSAYVDGEPRIVAAMFYSAWCSACGVLDPKLRDVAPEFDGRAIQFVKFDFSLGPNEVQQAKAASLGIEQLYLQNEGATGFMLLIDRTTRNVLASITMTMDRDAIRTALDEAITKVATTPVADQAQTHIKSGFVG